MIDQLISESDHPETTRNILNKSTSCLYPFGCILHTQNRIHIMILKEYRKRWLSKQILTDIYRLVLILVKKYKKVYAICSSTEYSIIRLIELFCFNFEHKGVHRNKEYVLYSLGGINR